MSDVSPCLSGSLSFHVQVHYICASEEDKTTLILAEAFYTLTVSVVAVLCRCHTSLRQPDTMRAHLHQKTLDISQHDLSAKLLAGPPCCLRRYYFCLFQTFSPTAPSKRPVLSKGRTPTVFGARTTDTGGVSQSGRVHA